MVHLPAENLTVTTASLLVGFLNYTGILVMKIQSQSEYLGPIQRGSQKSQQHPFLLPGEQWIWAIGIP